MITLHEAFLLSFYLSLILSHNLGYGIFLIPLNPCTLNLTLLTLTGSKPLTLTGFQTFLT